LFRIDRRDAGNAELVSERRSPSDCLNVISGFRLELPRSNQDSDSRLCRGGKVPTREVDGIGCRNEFQFLPELILPNRSASGRPSQRG